MRFRSNHAIAILSLTLLFGQSAVAQGPPPGGPHGPGMERDIIYFNYSAAMEPQASGPAAAEVQGTLAADGSSTTMVKDKFMFVSAAGFGGGETITGAPYSAEATTEIVQTLADGNRIVRKNSASVHRDGQGRIRKDQTLGAIGPWVASTLGSTPQLSFITDPVAGVQYVLDHDQRTAHRMPLRMPGGPGVAALGMAAAISSTPGVPMPPPPPPPPGAQVEWEEHFDIELTGPQGAAGTRIMARRQAGPGASSDGPRTEPLGKQTFDGVEADGTRTTVTIPAGAVGNERPIEIVSERWFAPSLQVVVLSTNSDPRMGMTTYRLAGISRNEPDASLFQVPASYTVTEPPAVSAEGFAECVAAGNPVMESFPRQCRTSDGKTYIEPPAPGSGPRMFTAPLPPPR
jgi:hypothetical protein